MASSGAKALRRATAQERLERETSAIAEALNVELPAAPRFAPDPDLAAAQRIEHQANILAVLREAIGAQANDAEDLSGLTRDKLNDEAVKAGVADPDKLPNKDAVITAIHDAKAKDA